MKVKFFIVKGKSEITSIHVRLWESNKFDQKTKTGLYVKQSNWSDKKGTVKNSLSSTNKDQVNNGLRNLENYLIDQYQSDYITQTHIGKNWLKDKVNNFFGQVNQEELHKVYFVEWIQKFIDDCPSNLYKGEPIKKRTIQHYTTTKYKIENYQKYSLVRLRFQDINLEFYRNFLFFCKEIEKINNNTIGGYITNIKKWCKMIDIEGLPINPQYRSSEFSSISNKTKDVYLTEEEINTIFDYDFSHSNRLENTRDNFIFGLRTGLRVSDFLNLQHFHFVDDFIEIETQKTGQKVLIPLHMQIKAILKKRNGELPRPISDAKFNEYVKEVCKEAGFTQLVEGAKMINKKDDEDFFPDIDKISKNKMRKEFGIYPKYELISSHTCRRSFATNLYGKLSNMEIMAITGHKTESQFLKYIKITPRENAEKLRLHWEQKNNANGKN